MISLRRLWPLAIAVCMVLCNTDWIVTPALRGWDAPLWLSAIVIPVAAAIELVWWFWFWRWVIRLIAEIRQVRSTIQFGKELEKELENRGYIARVLKHLEATYVRAIAPDNHIGRKIRRWGYLGLFVLGILPIPGPRGAGTIICAFGNWKRGMGVLIFGNTLHVLSFVWGWDLLFRLFGH